MLSNVSLEFAAQDGVDGINHDDIAFCAVDLDETPELSTYSHFNSIDIMGFYPHLISNGVRFDCTCMRACVSAYVRACGRACVCGSEWSVTVGHTRLRDGKTFNQCGRPRRLRIALWWDR